MQGDGLLIHQEFIFEFNIRRNSISNIQQQEPLYRGTITIIELLSPELLRDSNTNDMENISDPKGLTIQQ